MRRRCAVLVLGALIAAGCGGKSKPASPATAATPTATASSTAAPTTRSSTDCVTLGIDPTRMREGTCTHAGVTYVIVNEDHMLRLHTLSAKLSGIHATSSLTAGEPARAQGRFVVASIALTNRLELPQAFDRGGTRQAGLILDRTVYNEDVSTEKASDPRSCVSRKAPIGSGQTETCDVVFDVPAAAAADLGKHGSGDLYIVDFGSDLSTSIGPQTVGQIRLYR